MLSAFRFLYDTSRVPFGVERIQCFVLRSRFTEDMRDVETQLKSLDDISDYLRSSPKVERLLSLMLAVGNYLNGGTQILIADMLFVPCAQRGG